MKDKGDFTYDFPLWDSFIFTALRKCRKKSKVPINRKPGKRTSNKLWNREYKGESQEIPEYSRPFLGLVRRYNKINENQPRYRGSST
jgi:hypothetical protein